MSDNYHEEERRLDFHREENRPDDYRSQQFWADENAIESARIQKEKDEYGKKLLDENNFAGFAVVNGLPSPSFATEEDCLLKRKRMMIAMPLNKNGRPTFNAGTIWIFLNAACSAKYSWPNTLHPLH